MSERRAPTAAREELARLVAELARAGTSVADLACGGRAFEPWTIYPDESGVYDLETRSQFYFHRHGGAMDELGHFHTVRLFRDRTAHLVAISIAHDGRPQALSTLNFWAIGDAEEPPDLLKRYVRHFRVDERRGDRRLVRFVNLVFEGFRDEIEWLQEEKARALTAYRAAHGDAAPHDDRSLEILSRVAIEVA
jgi:uncharacterized protein DUF6969